MGLLTALGVGSLLAHTGVNIFNTISSNRYAQKNADMQRFSQDEAKFMNRNQFQIQSSDALKAGINPLAMQGGSVQSASASNVEAPQMDTAALSNILGLAIQGKIQKDAQLRAQEFTASEANKNREHEELLASMKIDAENKRASERLSQEDRHFNANLDEIKANNLRIHEIQSSNLSLKEKEIQISRERLDIERTSADALNNLREQQSSLNKAELYSNCRELATQILTGFSKDKGGLFGLLERMQIKFDNNLKKKTSSLSVDELADLLVRNLKND